MTQVWRATNGSSALPPTVVCFNQRLRLQKNSSFKSSFQSGFACSVQRLKFRLGLCKVFGGCNSRLVQCEPSRSLAAKRSSCRSGVSTGTASRPVPTIPAPNNQKSRTRGNTASLFLRFTVTHAPDVLQVMRVLVRLYATHEARHIRSPGLVLNLPKSFGICR